MKEGGFQHLTKLYLCIPSDAAVSLLRIYSEDTCSTTRKHTQTNLNIEVNCQILDTI